MQKVLCSKTKNHKVILSALDKVVEINKVIANEKCEVSRILNIFHAELKHRVGDKSCNRCCAIG